MNSEEVNLHNACAEAVDPDVDDEITGKIHTCDASVQSLPGRNRVPTQGSLRTSTDSMLGGTNMHDHIALGKAMRSDKIHAHTVAATSHSTSQAAAPSHAPQQPEPAS